MKGWVDSGQAAPAWSSVVMRKGELAFAETVWQGGCRAQQADAARHDLPHLLHDQAADLDSDHDALRRGPLSARRPDLEVHPRLQANPRVYAGGSRGKIESVPAEREITFRDLLTHTSGLTYGFMESNPVDALYRGPRPRASTSRLAKTSLKEVWSRRLATFPLIAQPGKAWNYSRLDRCAGLPRRGHLRPAVREVPQVEKVMASRSA